MVDSTFQQSADMFNFAKDKMDILNKKMESVLNMLPKEAPIKATISGKEVMAGMLKDGRILLEFTNQDDAQKYFDSLK